MRCAALYGAGDVRVEDVPEPVPAEGESLVRITGVGLCGSDLHWFTEGGIGDAVLDALSDCGVTLSVTKLAVRDLPGSGKPEELLAGAGIDAAAIADAVRALAKR